jgi:hypothetical protein
MVNNNFEKVVDGQITRLEHQDNILSLTFCDWQEKMRVFVFEDVLAFEVFGVLNEELSHVTVDQDNPFLKKACSYSQEAPEDFRCYSFYSAWKDDLPLLQIVAKNWFAQNRSA